MTASAAVASLGAVVASGMLLGLEVWVVAIAALGYVVSRQTITAGLLTSVAAALGASAIVYVAAVMAVGRLAQLF